MTQSGSDIQKNLAHVKSFIQECELRYARIPNSVRLLAVSKSQPVEKILAAISAGQYAFGENYLQEALVKMETLANEKIEWHFIGPIQSNKTKKIAESFSWVQSVSSFNIAKRLNDQRPEHLPPLNICLQINTSGESSKSGAAPSAALTLAKQCLTLPRLKLRGLMTIPAPRNIFSEKRAELNKLLLLQNELLKNDVPLDILSMGMSEDLEAAIAEGSTMVRVGTKIFGDR